MQFCLLGWEDPLEEGMAIHSSILAWRIPWTEEPGRLQSVPSQRVGHNWSYFTYTHSTFRLCIFLNQQASIVILCVNIQMLHGGFMCSISLNLLQVRYTLCASIDLQLFVGIPTPLKSAIFSTIISISPELLMSVAATLYFNHKLGLQGRCPGGSQRSLGHPSGTRS